MTSGKIRLSLITFSKKSRTIVPLSTNQTLHDFASKLNSILPSHSTGDIHRGLDAAVDELTSNRRSDVRAVMIFVASGKVADGEGTQFDKAFAKFQAIKNVDAFALSLNPFNDIKTLEVKLREFEEGINLMTGVSEAHGKQMEGLYRWPGAAVYSSSFNFDYFVFIGFWSKSKQ